MRVPELRAHLHFQTARIGPQERIIKHVVVEVDSAPEADRVLADEPSGSWVVVSGAVVIETGFRVGLAPCVLEWVPERARKVRDVAEGIVGVGVRDRSRRTAQRCDGPQTVRFVVVARAASQLRQRLVDLLRLRVTGDFAP